MLKSCAIICELNPIHKGHCHIIKTASEKFGAESVKIAVMSGHFTQRCTPAILDKYTRAEFAVRAGADIVVELPFPWSASGVEDFARGGIYVASALLADGVVFGSESGEAERIFRAAEIKDTEEFTKKAQLVDSVNRDVGSAAIFDRVMAEFGVPPFGANDKLGMEYVRFGKKFKMTEFHPVPRILGINSASEIRARVFSEGIDWLKGMDPAFLYEMLAKNEAMICDESRCDELFFHHCRLYLRDTDNPVLQYAVKTAKLSANSEEFIRRLPTKKYTLARMRREILFSILDVQREMSAENPQFTVLLAANEKGREYLRERGKSFAIPVITKPADGEVTDGTRTRQYKLQLSADELYALLINKPAGEFVRKHPRIQ